MSWKLTMLFGPSAIIVLVVLLTAQHAVGAAAAEDISNNTCQKEHFGQDSFVCTCSSDHCDFYEPLELPVNKGEAHIVVSDLASKRFERDRVQFTDKPSPGSFVQLVINPEKKFQKLFGFGGAFTDAAGRNIATLKSNLQDTLLRSYYADNGLDYNIGRLNMGGCDFSVKGYTYADVPGDDSLSHFNLTVDDLVYKIPYVKQASKIKGKALRLFASPWTAPAWMKTNNDLIGKGYLKPEYYQTWADYFIRFLDAYKEEGVDFWGLTVQNEPTNGDQLNFKFNCMGWNATTQANWIAKNFGPTLKKSKHSDVKVMILDDQRVLAPRWCREVFANKEAEPFVDGVAIHWYTDRMFDFPNALDQVHQEFPDKFMLYSEACTGDLPFEGKPLLGSWKRGEQYLHNILEDLNHWVTGWTDWNLALDLQGGPNWTGNFVDAPIIVDAKKEVFYRNPMFYALGHISRFAPEGSTRIEAVRNTVPDKVDSIAFQRADGGIAVVLVNRDKNKSTRLAIVDKIKGVLEIELAPSSFTSVLY